jgi:hypothetical protein
MQTRLDEIHEDYVDTAIAGALLHVHPRTIRRLMMSQELDGLYVARKWLVSVQSIRDFIERKGEPRPWIRRKHTE